MFNIIFSAKKRIISVKNEFFSRTISFLEIIPLVIVLSPVKLRVRQRVFYDSIINKRKQT